MVIRLECSVGRRDTVKIYVYNEDGGEKQEKNRNVMIGPMTEEEFFAMNQFVADKKGDSSKVLVLSFSFFPNSIDMPLEERGRALIFGAGGH